MNTNSSIANIKIYTHFKISENYGLKKGAHLLSKVQWIKFYGNTETQELRGYQQEEDHGSAQVSEITENKITSQTVTFMLEASVLL